MGNSSQSYIYFWLARQELTVFSDLEVDLKQISYRTSEALGDK